MAQVAMAQQTMAQQTMAQQAMAQQAALAQQAANGPVGILPQVALAQGRSGSSINMDVSQKNFPRQTIIPNKSCDQYWPIILIDWVQGLHSES